MGFREIKEKVESGERISTEEALYLFDYPDLLELGLLARKIKEKRYGRKVFFNRNLHLNLTNICISGCRFCSYRKKVGEEGAYTLSLEEALRRVEEAQKSGITEVHIVNGLHPELSFNYYLQVANSIKEKHPHLILKAFTAVEVDYFSRISGLSYAEVLKKIWEAGVRFLPGGGVEIFSRRVRNLLGVKKLPGEKWVEIHQLAHSMVFKTNATMLFGHFETKEEIVEHLNILRKAQDKSGGFLAFIPLRFQPWRTEIKKPPTTCVEDLRIFALSRIFLDNFPHIKAYWVTVGVGVAQLALHFGADDIDGTIKGEMIMHAAGSPEKKSLTVSEVIEIIKEAGLMPVERDTFYRLVRSYAA